MVTLIADNTDLTERVNSHDDSYTEAIRQIIQEYNSYYSLAEDYLVTSKKDTIRCKLRTPATTYHLYGLPDENFKLQYRLPKTKTFLSVDLDTISEYGFKDSVLTKRQLPGSATWRFLHWIERGHIDLYAYGHFVEDNRYFVSKDNSPLVEIKYDGIDPLKIRTMVLCDIIADDEPLAEELKNAPVFNYHVIAYIVKTYNQFKNGH